MNGRRFPLDQLRRADRRLHTMAEPDEQLRTARQQAEGYRNFLTSLTGLLSAVFVLKGNESLGALPSGHRWAVVALLITGFAALITASWLTVSAVHGRPGETLVHEATHVLRYELARVRAVWSMVEAARWLALAGVLCVAAAVVVTWLAPALGEG